jgi:hypothetical protein
VPDLEDLLEPEADDRISAIFRHFEALTTLATGRTVGRKIGIVQEIMLKKYLEADERLRRRMYLEQLLEGRSGAAHKVEFSWYPIATHVGLRAGDEVPGTGGLRIASLDETAERVRLDGPWTGRPVALSVGALSQRRGPLRTLLDEQGLDLRVVGVDEGGAEVDVVDRSQLLASLESKRVGAQRFSASNKLGSGIQTIEKAKQASLVAIDLDLKHNANVKPLEAEGERKKLISLVALGNGVHWTEKDRAILATFVDYTFFVKDEGIIRYATFVEELADEDDDPLEAFMAYFKGLTKQEDDSFSVSDSDFDVVAPEDENRTLREVLVDHISEVNP